MQDTISSTAPDSVAAQASDNRRLWWPGLPCLLLAVTALYFFPLASLNLPGLIVMVVSLAWCLYQYFLPLHLIRRHALLEHVTSNNSVLRRWLWKGLWSRLLLLVWSLMLSLAVLVLLNGFSYAQWLLLVVSVPAMLLLVPVGMRLAGAESGARYHFPLALRVAVYLTITLTTLGLIALQLLGEGVPDTRHLTLLQLVSQSWSTATGVAAQTATVREIGWLLGAEAVINDVVWYLMQQASTLSEQSAVLKLAAWLVFLLFITVQAAVFWFVLAGLLSWLMGRRHAQDRLLQGAHIARSFASGVFALGVLAYLLTLPGVTGFMSALADRSMQALPIPAVDPCARQIPAEIAQLQTESTQAMTVSAGLLQEQLLDKLDADLDSAFALAEPAVDEYLEWNFSVPGQYAQLFFLAEAASSSLMAQSDSQTLGEGIEQRFGQYTASKIDEHIGSALAPELGHTRVLMQQQFADSARQFYLQQAVFIEEQLDSSACLKFALPALSMPDLVNKSAVGVGPVAGLVVAGIAARGSARIGANVLTRNVTKRAVSAGSAKAASHVATKTAQSTGWSGLGLTCGPLAPVCVPALFVATWFATDLLINEIDESINREALRTELLAALDAEKQRLKSEYQAVFSSGMSQLMADISHERDQRFRILEQGI